MKNRNIQFEKNAKKYFHLKLRRYPDVLTAADIKAITGYSKEAIRTWIINNIIPGIKVKKKFFISKEDLIKFLISPRYMNIIRKSKIHKMDIEAMNGGHEL